MKNTIYLLFLVCSSAIGLQAQTSVAAGAGYGQPCSMGGRPFCGSSIQVTQSRIAEEDPNAAPIRLFKDSSGHLVMQVNKKTLTEEQDRLNYKNKFAFFVEQDFTLNDEATKSLYPDTNKNVIIEQGMYPIIEWENHYYIRF